MQLGWKLSEPACIFRTRGGHRPEHIHAWLRKRGSDSQGRLCPVVRSWELAVFFL